MDSPFQQQQPCRPLPAEQHTTLMLTWSLRRALVQGGGLATVLGDDFQKNTMLCHNCTFTRNEATMGGGVYQSGGNNTFASSSAFSLNRAQQQGGAVAFHDICGDASYVGAQHNVSATACLLNVTAGTAIAGNTALVGGGVFVATPGTRGINTSQLAIATAGGNAAVYAEDLAIAPGRESLALTRLTKDAVASSIGKAGAMGLVVSADQNSTRLQVEFCRVEGRGGAYLTGIESVTVPTSNKTLYSASFEGLRLMRGADNASYCLRVFAPDYPLVRAQEFNVSIRGCTDGEYVEGVGGCTPCAESRYSFGVNGTCTLCDTNAECRGGARFVPQPGFWHSEWNSANVHTCPNMQACGRDRRDVRECQANRTSCNPAQYNVATYSDLQCALGYQGRLCAQCAPGYGSGTVFSCRKCASRRSTAVFLVLVCAAVCLLVAGIGYQAVCRRPLAHSPRRAPAAASAAQAHPEDVQIGDSSRGRAANNGAEHHQRRQRRQRRQQQQQEPLAHVRGIPAALSHAMRGVVAADVFKVLVVYLQYMAILHNLVIDWPPTMQRLMGLAKLFLSPGSSDWVLLI
jgi:hypothetical protein